MESLSPGKDAPFHYHYPRQYVAPANEPHIIELFLLNHPASEAIKIPLRVNGPITLDDLEMLMSAIFSAAPVNALAGIRVLTAAGEILCRRLEGDEVRAWTGEQTVKVGQVAKYRVSRYLSAIQRTA